MNPPDPTALAVLLDAMCAAYGYTRAEAEEAEKYARNVGAVRDLLKHSPVGPEEYVEDEWQSICRDCGVNVDPAQEAGHLARCLIVAAWRALSDPRGAADIEQAHVEALHEETFRQVRRHELAARARPDFYGVRDATWQREYLGQFPLGLNPVSDRADALAFALVSRAFRGVEIDQAIFDEADVLTRIDAGTPLPPSTLWRTYNERGTMFTREGELTADRQRSDAGRTLDEIHEEALELASAREVLQRISGLPHW